MAEQRVSPGQQWVMRAHGPNHLPTRMSKFRDVYLTVNEVYDNLDGGRTDYATMKDPDGDHAFTIELPTLRLYFLLAKNVPADTPRNPAEQRAADQGLPVVLAIPSELAMVMQGRSIIYATKDGGEALVRLMRPDEMRERLLAARADQPQEWLPPMLTDEEIERMVRPVRFP